MSATRDEAHDETGEIFKAVCGLPGAFEGFTDGSISRFRATRRAAKCTVFDRVSQDETG
jgi:hypothetical protein